MKVPKFNRLVMLLMQPDIHDIFEKREIRRVFRIPEQSWTSMWTIFNIQDSDSEQLRDLLPETEQTQKSIEVPPDLFENRVG
jgi:hypothetical protein